MALRIDILTLFPEIFFGPFDASIIARARKKGIVDINTVNVRDFAHDKHKTVDDTPYGGGPGMLMKPEPLFEAVRSLKTERSKVILTGPRGQRFSQPLARKIASEETHLIFICGHYEGVDERVRKALADWEFSIGDYILTSGNLAAMVMTDAIVRLLPGALGDDASGDSESFEDDGLLEYPQYTRPPVFEGMEVPQILRSGAHEDVERWRKAEAWNETVRHRPDLI
ncbi:MAG: tRNA (guanosine(37)-N1)-methyltransferase TrmD [Lentisphaeria bacterium]|nr:tRNA (guanosine(37)-N1)-methyltransferase TrmD [Lentisphaeria bacterium]